MPARKRKDPNPAKTYEVEDSLIIDTEETTGPEAETASSTISASSWKSTMSGTGTWTPAGPSYISPTAISPTTWGGGLTVKGKPSPAKIVDAPTKRPKKILIAFLDEDDNTEWSAKLHPGSVSIDYNETGVPEMSLCMHLTEAD